jgi:hypothetical protein
MISPERRSSTPTPPPDGSAHISDPFHSQYVNGVPGHYEVVQYPGPITCLSCLLTVWFFPLNFLVFCCPCDKKTEFHPHGGMVAAPPGATVTYYQQPQPVAQYQQPPQQQPGYYPKT